jgi:hypothetical protein
MDVPCLDFIIRVESSYLNNSAEEPLKSSTVITFHSSSFQIHQRLFPIDLGIGENIRGTALGTADRATSSVAGVQKNADVATKGRAEIAQGMARMKGHAPTPQTAPTETAPPGTAPADQRTTSGTGTGTGTDTGAAVGGAAAGATDQGRQQGTSDEKTSALGGKSGSESTG